MEAQETAEKDKGGRGRKLEPHGPDLLRLYREGKTIRAIVEWLAEPPRNVTVSAPSVHVWIKRRIALLTKRAEEMKAIHRDLLAPAETTVAQGSAPVQAVRGSAGTVAAEVPITKARSAATDQVASAVESEATARPMLKSAPPPEGFVGPAVVGEPVAPSAAELLRRMAAEQDVKDRGPTD